MTTLPRVGMKHLLVDRTETVNGTVTPAMPYGGTLMVVHTMGGDGLSTGGFVTVYNTVDGTTKVAHQGGTDAVNVKTTNTATSYCAVYKHVTEQVIIDLAIVDGTHSVDLFWFND